MIVTPQTKFTGSTPLTRHGSTEISVTVTEAATSHYPIFYCVEIPDNELGALVIFFFYCEGNETKILAPGEIGYQHSSRAEN